MLKFDKTTTKVLLVDDEPNIVLAIEFLLEQQGLLVHKAYNGLQALEQMEAIKPDIVVLDVMMPGMDGFEVAKAIRGNPSYENTRIVFLTAKGTEKDKWTGYGSGGEYYLTKPFDNKQLVSIITEIAEYK